MKLKTFDFSHILKTVPKEPVLYISLYIGLAFIFMGTYRFLFFVEPFGSNDVELRIDKVEKHSNELTRELLRIHSEPFSGFKSVETTLGLIGELSAELTIDKDTAPAGSKLNEELGHYLSELENQADLVERYKISLTSYRASEKYAPIAKKQLLQEISGKDIKNAEAYRAMIDTLYGQVLTFIRVPDSKRFDSIIAVIDRAEKKLNNISPPLDNISSFISQSRVLVESKIESNTSLRRTLSESVPAAYLSTKEALDEFAEVADGDRTSNLALFFWMIVAMAAVSVLIMLKLTSGYRRLAQHVAKAKSVESSRAGDNTPEDPDLNLDAVVTTLSHQIETPLKYIQENVDSLCPVLEEIHETFDALENDHDKKALPNSLAYLIKSSSVSEFPFAISEIKDGIRSAKIVVSNIRRFARKERTPRVVMDLNQIIDKVIKMKSKSLDPIATVKLKLSSEPAILNAVPNDIRHVIDCLIDNALDAVDDGYTMPGLIEVTTVVQKNTVKLMVRDNGAGIPDEIQNKIFEPFFSTKKSGVGMGLALVKKTLDQHNAKIDIASHPESGSIVRISFTRENNISVDLEQKSPPTSINRRIDAPKKKLVAVANDDKTQIMFHKNKKKVAVEKNDSPGPGKDFDQLNKLARSLAESVGKKAVLVTTGIDDVPMSSEAKRVLLEISEQCIRNSIEHGIEEPYYRMYVGKPQTGSIELALSKANDGTIGLSISDDGKGIDYEAVRSKAAEMGMHSPQELASWNQDQLTDLIFGVGFSTVQRSDGRGIGMNAIRTLIKNIDGKIDIASRKGVATRLKITIPQTMGKELAA